MQLLQKIKQQKSNIYYWFAHRFIPSQRYNIIRLNSLSPGYYDPDVRMLHGCFDLFTEWFKYNVFEAKLMDRATVDEQYNGNYSLYDEMMELYKWWTVYRDMENNNVDLTYKEMLELDTKDDLMLARLIKIRRHIWYL